VRIQLRAQNPAGWIELDWFSKIVRNFTGLLARKNGTDAPFVGIRRKVRRNRFLQEQDERTGPQQRLANRLLVVRPDESRHEPALARQRRIPEIMSDPAA